MDFFVNLLQHIPSDTWSLLATGAGVSVVAQFILRWFESLSPRGKVFVVGALSFIGSAIQYLASAAASDPAVLGAYTAQVLGFATIFYRVVVQPFSNLLTEAKSFREGVALQAGDKVVGEVAAVSSANGGLKADVQLTTQPTPSDEIPFIEDDTPVQKAAAGTEANF